MTPGAHWLASWLMAHGSGAGQRERRLICVAGLAPDLDGFGWFIDQANSLAGHPSHWYEDFHHVLGHNLLAAVVVACCAAGLGRGRRVFVGGLSLLAFHLHLVCDLIGSGGPDGHRWSIHYLAPIDREFEWAWSGQWALSSWQNTAIMVALLSVAGVIGWRQRCSFLEVISVRLDRAFFADLDRRWKRKGPGASPD